MSTPWVLMGEVAGRNTKGMVSVMLAEGGKEMREDRATVEFTDTLELHWRVVVVVGAYEEEEEEEVPPAPKAKAWEEVHPPAVAGVVVALLQHAQEPQPLV